MELDGGRCFGGMTPAAGAGRKASLVRTVHTPRAIRIRVARTPTGVRKTAKAQEPTAFAAAAPTGADSPPQQIARSLSGKTALGPWCGAFEKHASAELDEVAPTLFVDARGAAHFALGSAAAAAASVSVQAADIVRAAAMRAKEADAQAEDAQSQAAKELAAAARGRAHAALQRQAALERAPRDQTGRPSRNVKQLHMIQQPRRLN